MNYRRSRPMEPVVVSRERKAVGQTIGMSRAHPRWRKPPEALTPLGHDTPQESARVGVGSTQGWAALVKPEADTRHELGKCNAKRWALPTYRFVKTLHLFAHMLADWFILSCDITRSWCTLIFDGHNPDVSAFEQPNFIAADLFSTGRNARNLNFCYDHFRPLELN